MGSSHCTDMACPNPECRTDGREPRGLKHMPTPEQKAEYLAMLEAYREAHAPVTTEDADLVSFQDDARRTANLDIGELDPRQLRLMNWALGLAGEVGELVDHIKKAVFHGHELDLAYFEKEQGDILWYQANLASETGSSLARIASVNTAKLRNRYPDGFSQQASQDRKCGHEWRRLFCDRSPGHRGLHHRDNVTGGNGEQHEYWWENNGAQVEPPPEEDDPTVDHEMYADSTDD